MGLEENVDIVVSLREKRSNRKVNDDLVVKRGASKLCGNVGTKSGFRGFLCPAS